MKIENVEVSGWEAAIRGARNPLESWDKSDSGWVYGDGDKRYYVGAKDLDLMRRLRKAGSDEGKFMRMLNVTFDMIAPSYFWQQVDTYKVATVRNSCSKMHKIHAHEITESMFTHNGIDEVGGYAYRAFLEVLKACEELRNDFNKTGEKRYWRALIELLPEGFELRATMQLNYETIRAMYHARKNHKLPEWHEFCAWAETLPCAKELIVGD